jgi:A/G-specific adenine glycosylase
VDPRAPGGEAESASRRALSARAKPLLPAARRDAIRRRLVEWYRAGHRDLPWRRTRDPYRIWLSEAMLQQTRVDTVVPYYERFVERFPDVRALAAADEDDVLKEWAGLGYYSRARNLKRAAEIVVREHGGSLPRDAEALRALPGIGPYTVGAIRSIAFRDPAPVVDGNVTRVLARLTAAPRPDPRDLWSLAADLVPADRPDLFNQALMELGALVCTPRTPRCTDCPLARICAARTTGDPESYPAPRERPKPRQVQAVAGLLERSSPRSVLLFRRPARGLLAGMWELPSIEGTDPAELIAYVRERTGLTTRPGAELGRLRHVFTHRELTLRLLRLHRTGPTLRSTLSDDARWFRPAELGDLPLSSLARKSVTLCGHDP